MHVWGTLRQRCEACVLFICCLLYAKTTHVRSCNKQKYRTHRKLRWGSGGERLKLFVFWEAKASCSWCLLYAKTSALQQTEPTESTSLEVCFRL